MTILVTNQRERTRFLRFATVGVIGAFVDFGIMNLLTGIFKIPLVIAGTISFLAAVISNFTWNRYWTYPDSRSKPILGQLISFTIVNAIGIAIRIPLLAVLEPIMESLFVRLPVELPFFSAKFYADNLTLAVAVIVVMFWNFFVNRYWTYNDVK
jgi:putative flippase GtrA